MMKHCPNCGAETHLGARFCRRCGAPVRNMAGGDGDDNVSPQAATVRFGEEGRATDGLAPDDPRRASADTSRVNQDELQRLLQAQRSGERPAAGAGGSAYSSYQSMPLGDSARSGETPTTGEIAPPPGGVSEDFGLKTRASFPIESDEDLTVIAAPRVSRPFDTEGNARRVEPTPDAGAQPLPGEARALSAPLLSPAPSARAPRRKWPYAVVASVVLLSIAAGAVVLGYLYLRRPDPPMVSSPAPTPPPDVAQLFEEKLAQAEGLLASGQMDAALGALREANQLDPANWKAHRRLGELLWESGARRAAIEEYRAAATNNPNDFTLWRALASAQLAEGLHPEAVESYGRLIALVGEPSADPNDLLSYADALRQAGRADEARAVYQKLSSATQPEIAAAARQRLAELAQPTPTPSPGQKNSTATPTPNTTPTPQTTPTPPSAPTPQPTPPPQPTRPPELSPTESYQRGVQLWSSNRGEALALFRRAAQAGNPDAHYYLGLSYVEGRDLSRLNRAEIVAALAHFQHAQRGQNAARARQLAQQLEKEFDRIRKQ